jgi:hypothetical protein
MQPIVSTDQAKAWKGRGSTRRADHQAEPSEAVRLRGTTRQSGTARP